MEVPNYLWGEKVRHSTYLINRIATKTLILQTPYEALKGRKLNITHLRVFGCTAYAKTEASNLKKLYNGSHTLVHLGTEPGSKAYRLFDPTQRGIVVSRDVFFDEEKTWMWNKSEGGEETKEPGMFKVSLKEYESQGNEDRSNVSNSETHKEGNEIKDESDLETESREETEDREREETGDRGE